MEDWDPAAQEIIQYFRSSRILVHLRGINASDNDLSNISLTDTSSTKLFFELVQELKWSSRTFPTYRNHKLFKLPPPPDLWIRLDLTECLFPLLEVPLFLQIFVYDGTNHTRLSEVFHLACIPPENKSWFETIEDVSAHTGSASACFPISLLRYPKALLVIKVDRILEKSPQESGKIFFKKMSLFRQSWALNAIPLGEITTTSQEKQLLFSEMFLRKPTLSLNQTIDQIQLGSDKIGLKTVGCSILFQVKKGEILEPRKKQDPLSSHKYLYHATRQIPLQELQVDYFQLLSSTPTHLVYVHPLAINQKKNFARNITCLVEVYDENYQCLQLINDRRAYDRLTSKTYTNVTYHEKVSA
jgi:hypothetical protein